LRIATPTQPLARASTREILRHLYGLVFRCGIRLAEQANKTGVLRFGEYVRNQ
jgi:hypothetical protein